jgi:hypothetical protein
MVSEKRHVALPFRGANPSEWSRASQVRCGAAGTVGIFPKTLGGRK